MAAITVENNSIEFRKPVIFEFVMSKKV